MNNNFFCVNSLVSSWKFKDSYALGFHGTHIGLKCLHGFRGIYWSIFRVIPTKEFIAMANIGQSIISLNV